MYLDSDHCYHHPVLEHSSDDSEIHTLVELYIFNALLVFHTRVDVPWTLDNFQVSKRETVLVSIVF